jgi:hypothetical protein
MPKHGLTRRRFLEVAATAVSATAASAALAFPALAGDNAKVVVVRDAEAVDAGGCVRADVVCRMLDDAVTELVGGRNPSAAWGKLFAANDTVGIKSSFWRFLPTPKAIEDAVTSRILETGVPRHRVAVDDYGVRGNPVFQRATALVNMRPLRTHHWSGPGTCLKNYMTFAENPGADPDPALIRNTRLSILIMLTPLYHANGAEEFSWNYGGLVVGTDPVAADITGLRILDAKRNARFEDAKPDLPEYMCLTGRTAHITVRKIGWAEEAFV